MVVFGGWSCSGLSANALMIYIPFSCDNSLALSTLIDAAFTLNYLFRKHTIIQRLQPSPGVCGKRWRTTGEMSGANHYELRSQGSLAVNKRVRLTSIE